MTVPAQRGVLSAVVVLAQQTLPGAVGASITLVSPAGPTTAAATDGWAIGLDEAQYSRGSGPCVDAALGGEIREMTDAGQETRWPSYVSAARVAAALSSLSVPIPGGDDDEAVGSLNVFRRTAGPFGAGELLAMRRLAAMAGTAMGTQASGSRSGGRAVVDQAKGILMSDGCTPQEALDQLGQTAYASSRSVRDVAQDLVRSTVG